MKKELLNQAWKFANKIASPYFFIGEKAPRPIVNTIDKVKLFIAVRLYNLYYRSQNKNGALLFTGKA